MTGPVPLLLALDADGDESDVVAALSARTSGLDVVRRCVDLADLLAAAAAGRASVALVSADLRRLDRDAVARLRGAGVAVVGRHRAGDELARTRLLALGCHLVLADDLPAAGLVAALRQAASPEVAGLPGATAVPADPAALLEQPAPAVAAARGTVLAVWGPTGAPGRSTVAVGVAAELAASGLTTLLVDADVHGGVVAHLLGLLDESAGLATACRAANAGPLTPHDLARHVVTVSPALHVLTGIARADRWPELRPAALEVVLEQARALAQVVVVDLGFGLEQDEELSYDTAAPRRHGATLAVLDAADVVLAVGSADPVGLQRLVRGLGELREAVPDVDPLVVANRLRATGTPGDPAREVPEALRRWAGVQEVHLVPLDVAGCDRAVARGQSLVEAAPASPARQALRRLAAAIAQQHLGVPAPAGRRARRRA